MLQVWLFHILFPSHLNTSEGAFATQTFDTNHSSFYEFHDLNKLQLIKVDTANSMLTQRKFKFNQNKKKSTFQSSKPKTSKGRNNLSTTTKPSLCCARSSLKFFLFGGAQLLEGLLFCLMTAVELGKVEQKIAKYQVGLHLSRILGPDPKLGANSKVVNIT